MKTLTSILIKQKKEKAKFFADPAFYAKRIKKKTEEILQGARVFLFGSVSAETATPQSDIDILIFSPNLPKTQAEKVRIASRLTRPLGIFNPFEVHLVDEKGLSWYERFANLKEI